jgi:hypothetical protein
VPAAFTLVGLLVLGLELFGLLVVGPVARLVRPPHADIGLDCAIGQPERRDIDQHIRAAQRVDRYVARRFWFDRPFDVRPFRRKLTC